MGILGIATSMPIWNREAKNTFSNLKNRDIFTSILKDCIVFKVDGNEDVTDYKVLNLEFFNSLAIGADFPLIKDDIMDNKRFQNKYSLVLNYIKYPHVYSKDGGKYNFTELIQDPPVHDINLDPIDKGLSLVRFLPGETDDQKLAKVIIYYGFLEKLNVVTQLVKPPESQVLKSLPIPKNNSSYESLRPDGGNIVSNIALDNDGNATYFKALDIEYFESNTERVMIPTVRARVIKLLKKIISEGGVTALDPNKLDFQSKECADLLHASITKNTNHLWDKYSIVLDAAEVETFMGTTSLFLGGLVRPFSEKKIIEPPVWKLVRCKDAKTYYTYAQPFYDYSITGIFSLANMGNKDPVMEKDRDFNSIGTYPNTYYLSGFTVDQAKIEYEKNRCSNLDIHCKNPSYLSDSWKAVSGKLITNYLYQTGKLTTAIPTIVIRYMSKESLVILKFFHILICQIIGGLLTWTLIRTHARLRYAYLLRPLHLLILRRLRLQASPPLLVLHPPPTQLALQPNQ